MEIHRIYTNYLQNSEKCANKPGKTSEGSTSAGKVSGNVDTIELSSKATFRSQLDSAKKSCTKVCRAEISHERITELRNKYQGDNCPVASEDIAGAIINRVLGSDDQN